MDRKVRVARAKRGKLIFPVIPSCIFERLSGGIGGGPEIMQKYSRFGHAVALISRVERAEHSRELRLLDEFTSLYVPRVRQ